MGGDLPKSGWPISSGVGYIGWKVMHFICISLSYMHVAAIIRRTLRCALILLKSSNLINLKGWWKMKEGTIFALIHLCMMIRGSENRYNFAPMKLHVISLLKAHVTDRELKDELTKVATLVYHMNSSAR